MRRIYILGIFFIIVIAGCKKQPMEIQSGSPEEFRGVVGISKIITHPALDEIERGIIDELRQSGYTNLTIDVQSANGEISTAASIAGKFRSQKVLVAVGIATPMALSLANTLKDTPVVFSAVTDPIDAGLRRSNGVEPGSNITGVSDMTPVKEQVELAARLVSLKKLGFIYNAGEANSVVLLDITKKVCREMGIELVTSTVNNTSEVKQAAEVVAAKVDAIYASTDNVVYASLGSLVPVAAKYNVPVIAAVPDGNEGTGILAAYGVDYYNAGRQTGKMVIRILNGEKPGDIPVKYMTEPDELGLYIDKSVAGKMGIAVPDDLAAQAEAYIK